MLKKFKKSNNSTKEKINRKNKTEEIEMQNLRKAFEEDGHLFTPKPDEYTIFDNSSNPSEKKDYILNADAILKAKNLPTIYVQNSSFANNYYIRYHKKDSKDPSSKGGYVTKAIGVDLQGIPLIDSIIDSLNLIFHKKSEYTDFPNGTDASSCLYLTCDSLLQFIDNSFDILSKILNQKLAKYIKQNSLDDKYQSVIVTFNPIQVHNESKDIDVESSHFYIDEAPRNLLLNLEVDSNFDENKATNVIKDKIIFHEYFLNL